MIGNKYWLDIVNGVMLASLVIMWGCIALIHGQAAVVSFNLLKIYIPFAGILLMVFTAL